MFNWMDYIIETEGVHILHAHNHISEVRIGPYLVDGYDPKTRTVYEFNGCYFHGCSDCRKDQDDLGKERKMHTETKEKYLHLKGYHMRIIWEHSFKLQEKSDVKQAVYSTTTTSLLSQTSLDDQRINHPQCHAE